MALVAYETADAFLDGAAPWLNPQQVEANVMLGIARRLQARPEIFAPPHYLATLHQPPDEAGAVGRVVGAALCTPPWHLVLHAEAGYEDALADAVARDLPQRAIPVTGVNGRVPASLAFARVWQERMGVRSRLETSLRAFVLHALTPPRRAPGALRQATLADLALVTDWLVAFDAEALPHDAGRRTEEGFRRILNDGLVWLWEDGGIPVSLVCTGRVLPDGESVGPVYTPPEQRGRGYASNATAALSLIILARGNRYVCLFTDLANPTSNKIYQAIGYQPVCDYADYGFA